MNIFFEIAQIIIPTNPVPLAPPGFSLAELGDIIRIVADFFTSIGVILAMIAIVVSGIMYMQAGSAPEAIKKAQTWFKNALIGGLIVLAVGMIINTLANIITRQFFCTLIFFGTCIIP